jgi:hypothetical protein
MDPQSKAVFSKPYFLAIFLFFACPLFVPLRSNFQPKKKLQALNKIIKGKKLNDKEDIRIINEFYVLDQKKGKLERLYRFKYFLILLLTFMFFISGIINYFIAPDCKVKIFGAKIPAEFFPIFFCISCSLFILCFIAYLNNIESEYREKFLDLMDKL